MGSWYSTCALSGLSIGSRAESRVGDVFVVTTQPCKRRRDERKNPLQTPARWGCRENVFR